MKIRPESENDSEAIYFINVAAFPTTAEAELVNGLRRDADPFLSLVAENDGEICGHILFTPATALENPGLKILGLAPMAVTPDKQNQGIGSALVRAGLERARELGYQAVIVLGHPEYYPKFGFQPASSFGIRSEYNVPDEVFMAQELVPGSLEFTSGLVKYHPAFAQME